jgi:beta-propeller repeat-containing protein
MDIQKFLKWHLLSTGSSFHRTLSGLAILILVLVASEGQGQEKSTTIVYSTYYGNIGTEDADAVAVDPFGNAYLGCHSNSPSLTGDGEHPYALGGEMDAFVVKLSDKGTEVSYVTHLGGSRWDAIQGLVSDSSGNIYAVGTTYSSDFPINANGFQPTFGGESDAFVVKLDSAGKIVWSTFLGGSSDEDGRDIAVDRHGNVHVVGRTKSNDFPALAGALQAKAAGGIDAFVATLDPEWKMLATTYLGGTGDDIGFAIELDNTGRRYITGTTNSSDFPVHNALQETHQGNEDLFVAVIDTTGSILEFSSYLGGGGNDQAYSISLGPSGDVFVMGITDSPDFPSTPGAFQQELAGASDAFVARVNLQKRRLAYSTYIGGENEDNPRNLVVDGKGRAYVVGKTASHNFPTAFNQQTELQGRADAFVSMLDPTGSLLVYSTLYGGEGLDIFEGAAIGSDGSLTVSGLSNSANFPTVNPLQQTFVGGRFDIVVARFIVP